MANIKKNEKTGLWWVRLSLGTDECGKRIQAYYSNKRKQEVEFWIAEQVAARKDGSIRKVIQIRTMEQLFAVWLEDHVRLTKATTTYHSYQSILNRVPKWFLQLHVDRVEPTHAQRLLADWHRDGLKASTINSRRAIFVGMFSWAIRMNNYKGTNPFSAVSKLNEGLKEMETYSVEELATYLRTAQDVMTTGNYAAIMLISYAGLRAREATALRWSDVDLERMVIMIKRTAIEVKGGYSFSNTKGKKVRVVTISEHVAEELRRIRIEQRYDSLRMGWRNEEDLICLGVSGAYLWHSGLRRRHIETIKAASLPKITLHGLRHTHASLLMEMGVHAKVIQERLGHADATLTMDTYAHVLHTLQSDTATQFEQLLKRKKTAQQSGS
ncbi:tyrosine-type recombinase/integrase [Exiguobacterium sp. S22-S28]|uniref:tyrosine-type recombinase/integrase n=1 Tax=Exiguobacterium sp. S22-S28 TaxID=3342768 RepID=UPI00372D1E50